MRLVWTVLGVLMGLLCLPILLVSGQFLWYSVFLSLSDSFYIPIDYRRLGLFWFVWGLAGLAAACYGTLRRQASGAWIVISFGFVLLAVFTTPESVLHTTMRKRRLAFVRVETVSQALHAWGAKNARLPSNEVELQSALQDYLGSKSKLLSPYARRGQLVPYQVIYVGNTAGPYLPQPPGAEPTVIYCAVSQDLKQFWLTATALKRDVDGPVFFLEKERRPWVVEGRLTP